MGELSKEGKLYLKDYSILDRARKEANDFLDSIVEEVYDNLQDENLEVNNFKIELFKSQSFKGQLQLQFRSLEENDFLTKEKVDIYIVYRDVRNSKQLPSSNAAKVFVYISDEAAELKEELDDEVDEAQIVEFDLSDSSQTAEEVTEVMIDKFNQLKDLLGEVLGDKN